MKQKSSKIDMSYSANLVNFKGRITVKIFSVNKITLIRFIWLFKFSLTKNTQIKSNVIFIQEKIATLE